MNKFLKTTGTQNFISLKYLGHSPAIIKRPEKQIYTAVNTSVWINLLYI